MLEYLPKRRRVSGLRIEARKTDSTRKTIAQDFVPEQLFIPVEKHHGIEPKITVRAGQQVLRGETLAEGAPGSGIANVHASSSGRVRDISMLDIHTANGPQQLRCIVIDTDGRDTPIDVSGMQDRSADPDASKARIEDIRRSGVVGLGGAAVSTSWKLTRTDAVPTLIINGAECEPYISCDDMLMREQAAETVSYTHLRAHETKTRISVCVVWV